MTTETLVAIGISLVTVAVIIISFASLIFLNKCGRILKEVDEKLTVCEANLETAIRLSRVVENLLIKYKDVDEQIQKHNQGVELPSVKYL